jgi:peptidoglycan/xylan/chitin deacetylase (PgdA/CDA1 family)
MVSIKGGNPHIAVLFEMLNHQGIIFERKKAKRNYACEIEIVDSFRGLKKKKNKLYILTNFLQINAINYLSGYCKDNVAIPVVNFYEEVLVKNITEIFHNQGLPMVRKWYWPKFKKAAFVSTHDIDSIFEKHSWHKSASLRSKAYLKMKNVLPRFDKGYFHSMLRYLERHKIKSTFFFFSHYEDKNYFSKMIEVLADLKHEVALHSISNSERELVAEIRSLREKTDSDIKGVRMHLLKFRIPQSWSEMERNLSYDMSFYKNERFGYRAGLCYPFHPMVEGRFSTLFEIPTLFMDWTAINRNMSFDDIRNKMYETIKYIERFHGCYVVNFHNEYFNRSGFRQIMKSLDFLISYINKHKYWKATGTELYRWWSKRERCRINIEYTSRGNIRGESSEWMPVVIDIGGKRHKAQLNKGRFLIKWDK